MKNILIIGCGLLGSSLLRRISRKKIAKRGKEKYFKLFDGNKIAKYIIDVSLGKKANLY